MSHRGSAQDKRADHYKQGGHVNSYTDPETGVSYDCGVVSFIDAGNATGLFDRLGVERGEMPRAEVTTEYFDFNTGAVVNFTEPDFTVQLEGLQKFLEPAEKYEPLIQGPGYFDFPESSEIPEDLLIPFGDFITKYGVEKAMPFIFQSTGLGVTDLTEEMTLFALQAFGASMARSTLGLQGSFSVASGRNQDLYDAIAESLGDDVLYSSTVVDTMRTDEGVFVTVKDNKTGKLGYYLAKRLLIAIEPTAENTKPFQLKPKEREVLSKFSYSRLYTGIIDNENLVKNMSYFNLPPTAEPDNYLALPSGSFTARIDYMGSGHYFRVTIIGEDDLTAEGAKEMVQKDFSTLIDSGVLEGSADDEVSWVQFNVHGPMHARVSEDDLKENFFQKLYSLQGRRSTWWTGGAWAVNFQTHLWQFDDIILPQLLEGLD